MGHLISLFLQIFTDSIMQRIVSFITVRIMPLLQRKKRPSNHRSSGGVKKSGEYFSGKSSALGKHSSDGLRTRSMERLNVNLRTARQNLNMSIEQAAEELDVSPITFGRWERGEQIPHKRALQRLCDIFALSATELGFNHLIRQQNDKEEAKNNSVSRKRSPKRPSD